MANNKIIFDGNTLIDLTGDTVTAADVLTGISFHLPSGEVGTGTCDYDSDTSEDTAQQSEILAGKTAHARGTKLTGTMPNRGAVTLEIDDVNDEIAIPQGYHDGSGKAKLDATEKAKIIAGNIKSGVEILGITGDYTGEAISAQSKTVTPTAAGLTVLPDTGYDYLSQVVVSAIPYVVTPNAAGGNTVTIAQEVI